MTAISTQEHEALQCVLSVMGDSVGRDKALKVLRKHKLDVNKSLDDLLQYDDDQPPPLETIIDLTSDDDELKKAMTMSMEESKFGPSTRAPDASWAMVPAARNNTPTPAALSRDEESLRAALTASLEDVGQGITVENAIREPGRPGIYRSPEPAYSYATTIVQALFHVPQVHTRLSRLPLSADEGTRQLLEVYTNLDLAQLSTVEDNELVRYIGSQRWDQSPGDSLCLASRDFLSKLATHIEAQLELTDHENTNPLFRYSVMHTPTPHSREPGYFVMIETGHKPDSPNELVHRLTNLLKGQGGAQEVITEASDVVSFVLNPPAMANSSWEKDRANERFVYPKDIYMDRFMASNYEITKEMNAREDVVRRELAELKKRKQKLTRVNDKDVIKNLQSTIHYYAHLANPNPQGNDPTRVEHLGKITDKLNRVLKTVKEYATLIDTKMGELQSELDLAYADETLKKHKYELRAVLVSTGVQGHKAIYSYTQDLYKPGVWWKTMDTTITEVTEDLVLNDPSPLLSGAGPYMLFYSRSGAPPVPREGKWPKELVTAVHHNNKLFLSELPPAAVEKVLGKTAPVVTLKESNSSPTVLSDVTDTKMAT